MGHAATVPRIDPNPPVRGPRVLVSFAERDRDEAQGVLRCLEEAGAEVLRPDESLKPGDALATRVDELLDRSDVAFILLTRHASHNVWLGAEASLALEQQRSRGRPKVVPVKLHRHAEIPLWIQGMQALDLSDANGFAERVERLREVLRPIQAAKPRALTDDAARLDRHVQAIATAARAQAMASRIRTALAAGIIVMAITAVATGLVANGTDTPASLMGFVSGLVGALIGYYFGSRGRLA